MSSVCLGMRYGCLRALETRDTEGMLEWMHDEDIASVFQNDFSSMGRDDVVNFIESTHVETDSFHFAVVDASDEYMGTVSLKNVDAINSNAEYAISMRKAAHGTGLSASATVDILRYAFEALGLHRVYLCVRSDNMRAKKFYEKVGFAYEGTARDALVVNGSFCNLDWFSALSTDDILTDSN